MTDSTFKQIRKNLEEEREKLLERIDQAEGQNVRSAGGNPSRSDLSTDYASKDRTTALLSMDRKALAQVEDALQRLDEGTYGKCEGCGEAIPPERLEILPYATLCVKCQSEAK